MTLPELYEQQQREIEQFKTIRDKAWADLRKEQEEIIGAFGSEDNLPEDIRKRMDNQMNSYLNTWSMEGGEHYEAIMKRHDEQRELMGVKSVPGKLQPKPETKNDSDQLTERQIELQKIIRQQQAIRARQQEQKRKR
ncbi:hypothetical protein [Mucilaginibacter ginsenosidivorax]|uniref:Uncharacterized protein n=1 Tax=Mucilaginibacter ginsenosidivorax TaxID=862126 RepID=A0A5B8WB23_9SPHI|nr:hypothetical protein [Mucilaginibacter ginsenosidivorax]QEC79338.1 hypothetical protein FSB76_26565 [Mucilaginibacter ginsenosidivorax]